VAPIPEDVLELLRQQSGLSIDLDGHFRHRGELITHERTLEVLWKSLERVPDGRYLVRIGRESGYVALEDAPYVIRAVSLAPAAITLTLTDGSSEPLRPKTLRIDREGVLHCQVKGDHRARFDRTAQVALGLLISEDPKSPGKYHLAIGDQTYPIVRE
jgi:uncharacterized protein